MRTMISAIAVLLLSACGSSSDTSTTAPAAPAKTYKLGETASAKGLDFTVTKVDQRSLLGAGGEGFKAEPGETFVVVYYTLKNTAGEALTLMDRPSISLTDAEGHSFIKDDAGSMMAGGMMKDPSGMASDLNPGVAAKTAAAWKVSKAAYGTGQWKLVVDTSPTLTFKLK